MNQILITKNNKIYYLESNYLKNSRAIKEKKNYLIILFFSSIICIVILFYLLFSYIVRANSIRKTSVLVDKYYISSAYQFNSPYKAIKLSNDVYVIGLLEIPNINISYPIISNCNDKLLKISICKFLGPLPNQIGNMCIAGHNYKNNLMFSNLNKLKIGDAIFITNLNNIKQEYIIYQKLEISQDDWKYMQNTTSTEITLITCNSNNNTKRTIIKAKVKG